MNVLTVLRAALFAASVAAVSFAQTTGSITNLSAQPNSLTAGLGTQVTFTCRITDLNVVAGGALVQRISTAGAVTGTLGTMRDDGAGGDVQAGDGIFTAILNLYETSPGLVRLRVSAAIQGSARRTLSPVLDLTVSGTATSVRILTPAADSYLNLSPIPVQGQIGDPSLNVSVNGIAAAKSGNTFSASVPLIEGTNTLTAVATAAGGTTGSNSVQVFLDTTPPRVTITSPVDGGHTTNSSIDVTGIVNDIVVGTVNPQQATVTVNGVQALVSNRTFSRTSVPLVLGANSIRAEGRDRVGNTYAQVINLIRDPVAAGTPVLQTLSGNSQTGPISTQLAAPLVVRLTNAQNQPAANVPVTFRVTESDGLVNSLPAVVVNTDGQGRAQVNYKLGARAGAGSNRVEAFATGFQGTAVFIASALNGTPVKIVVDSGLNQTGPVGQALPFPFIAIVTDSGNNRLSGVPVTFSVRSGGGTINGLTTFSTTSDSDGRVQVTLTLGLEEGLSNNLVEANFTGNAGLPAAFSASSLTPGRTDQTTISGVVLDNSNRPIPGVTIRMFRVAQGANNVLPLEIGTPATTDAQGTFRVTNAPVGIMKLMADGSTSAPSGAWPTLEYDLLTVAGRDNTIGMPVYLPRLDQVNRLCVTATTGGTLTLPQVPGFALTVAPGAATFPGGSRSGCVSVTPVNPDKVPMSPGFGQQPRFVVTIQPVGTTFNPPARIQIPNVDGLAPRSKTEMYSYDHDLAAFVAIGSGTVSEDASVIASDPGVGVLKAGWHCGGDPNPTGSAASLSVSLTAAAGPQIAGSIVDLLARGTPPLDSEYVNWEIIDDPADPDDDPSVGQFTATPSCPSQPLCVGKLKGVKFGTVTARVSFRCTTTNGPPVQSNLVKVRFEIGLQIKEVTFLSDIDLTRDRNAHYDPIDDPVWRSTNAAADNGEVAYVRNRKIKVSAKFEINPPLPSSISGITVEAEIPGLGKVQATNQTLSGNSYDFPATESDTALPSETKYHALMTFNWRATPDGITHYVSAGASANPVYVTLDNPRSFAKLENGPGGVVVGTRVPVTLLKLGIGAGGATDTASALAKTWASFSGPANITTWDGRRMYYYKAGVGFASCALNYVDLIQTNPESGQCGSFAYLLLGSLAVNNVQANWVEISVSDGDQMLVKNWAFSTTPLFPGAADFKWRFETNTPDPMVPDLPGSQYGQLTNNTGLAGQNSPKPSEKLFGFHFIVKANSGYYDPSYGVTYTGPRGFETSALEGYARDTGEGTRTAGGITYAIYRARKVNATTNITFTDRFSN